MQALPPKNRRQALDTLSEHKKRRLGAVNTGLGRFVLAGPLPSTNPWMNHFM
jgi:hypothetical protein